MAEYGKLYLVQWVGSWGDGLQNIGVFDSKELAEQARDSYDMSEGGYINFAEITINQVIKDD